VLPSGSGAGSFPAGGGYGKVHDDAVQRLVEAGEPVGDRHIHDGTVSGRAAVVLEAFQDARRQINFRQRVGEAAGELLLGLQAPAEERDREIGDDGEIACRTRQLPVVDFEIAHFGRSGRKIAERHVVEERAAHI
jgi:hypothetical protein